MKSWLFDIETTPKPVAELEKMMPESTANPVMPAHIANMQEAEIGEPPKYATKEHPAGDPVKWQAWIDDKKDRHRKKFEDEKEKWRTNAFEKKAKFIADAALDAHTAAIKIMGLWDTTEDTRKIVIVGAGLQDQRRLQNGKYPCRVDFHYLQNEMELMAFFVAFCKENIRFEDRDGAKLIDAGGRLVGYNIAEFDLKMCFRKCMMERVLPPWRLRKGRYWQDQLVVDLREVYQMGDRQYNMGGLDGLSRILGVKRKMGSGERFWRMWEEDPAEALVYHLEEGTTIRDCAEKMGVL